MNLIIFLWNKNYSSPSPTVEKEEGPNYAFWGPTHSKILYISVDFVEQVESCQSKKVFTEFYGPFKKKKKSTLFNSFTESTILGRVGPKKVYICRNSYVIIEFKQFQIFILIQSKKVTKNA